MKILEKEFEDRDCCGNHFLYKLDERDDDSWLCADCFINEIQLMYITTDKYCDSDVEDLPDRELAVQFEIFLREMQCRKLVAPRNRTTIKGYVLPKGLDSFTDNGKYYVCNDGQKVFNGAERYFIEYDGWHFEGATPKAAFNKVLKYIFSGGEE